MLTNIHCRTPKFFCNTHHGLYQYQRLPFGVASVPAIFQKLMEQVLQGLPRVVCYMDDVLVSGRNDHEHLENLEHVFECLHQCWLQCHFMQQSVGFLGYKIDAEGLMLQVTRLK